MDKLPEMKQKTRKVPALLYPFVGLWRFFAKLVELMGRAMAALLGLLVMIIGVLLTTTLIGAVIGIPLVIFGFLLVVRAFF